MQRIDVSPGPKKLIYTFLVLSILFLVKLLYWRDAGGNNIVVKSESSSHIMEPVTLSYGNAKPQVNASHYLEKKRANEKRMADEYGVKKDKADAELIYEKLMSDGVEIEQDRAYRIRHGEITDKDMEWLLMVAAAHMTEEEAFSVDMSGVSGFSNVKAAYDKRAQKTGLYYGDEILKQPGVYDDASFEDIANLLKAGAKLPDDFLIYASYKNNTRLAVDLKNAGYGVNANYYDALTGMTALEKEIEHVSWAPTAHSLDTQLSAIDDLLLIGVPLKTNDGTRDALDISLEAVSRVNDAEYAERLLLIAKRLNEKGIMMEESHHELLNQVSIKYPELFHKYAQDFR